MSVHIVHHGDGSAEYVFPARIELAAEVRDKIIAAITAVGTFVEKEVFGIRLALDEAIVNAIKHGNQLDVGKMVRVTVNVCQELFRCRIADQGEGYDPADIPDPLDDENLERPSGRGRLLMKYYMDEVVVQPPGNVVVMVKRPEKKVS